MLRLLIFAIIVPLAIFAVAFVLAAVWRDNPRRN